MKHLPWIFTALVLTSVGCRKPTKPPDPPIPVVTVAPVEQMELVEWAEFTGRTEAVERVEIRPRVSGHIEKVMFRAGQLVKKNDVLFEIDPRTQQAELNRREAEVQQAKVRELLAQKEAGRIASLVTNNAISAEEAEQRQSKLLEASAVLKAAEAARDSAKLEFEFTKVRSPIDGRVSRAFVTAGNYASGMAAGATLLTSVVSIEPIHVYADMDENTLLKLYSLMADKKITMDADGKIPVQMQLVDEEGFPHQGFIESFDNRIDPSSGSMVLRVEFDSQDGRIIPGLFARLRIPGSAKYPAILIDERAIGTDQAQKFVLTLTSSNTVAYRSVRLGPIEGNKRIIRSGLTTQDVVVVNGLQRVRPGAAVQPERVGQEPIKTNSNGSKSTAP